MLTLDVVIDLMTMHCTAQDAMHCAGGQAAERRFRPHGDPPNYAELWAASRQAACVAGFARVSGSFLAAAETHPFNPSISTP